MGKLSALLQDESKIPECLWPFLQQLRSIFKPTPFEPESDEVFVSQRLDDELVKQLVSRLNAVQSDGRHWTPSDQWCNMSSDIQAQHSPVGSRAKFMTGVKHKDVFFTTYEREPNNSVIHVVSQSNGNTMFGKIKSIFVHERTPIIGQPPVSETWLEVEYFSLVPDSMANPFARLAEPDVQAHLRLNKVSKPYLTRLSEVVAHCAWIVFEEKEIHHTFDQKSIGLLSLDR